MLVVLDPGPDPTLFTARTWKPYNTPEVRLFSVILVLVLLLALHVDQLLHVPPLLRVQYRHSYPVIADPPSELGAVQDRDAAPTVVLCGEALRFVGAPGTVAVVPCGVTVTSDEAEPDPTLLTARTWRAYSVPFVNPVIVTDVDVPLPVDVQDSHGPSSLVSLRYS